MLAKSTILSVVDLGFLKRGVRVQANYCDSTHCYIMPHRGDGSTLALVRQTLHRLSTCAKCRKFWDFKTTEIASAGFSATIQQTFVWQLPGLPDLFCCSYIIRMAMFIDISPTLIGMKEK